MSRKAAVNWLTVNSTKDVRYCQSARIRAPTSRRQIRACSATDGVSPTLDHHVAPGPGHDDPAGDEHDHEPAGLAGQHPQEVGHRTVLGEEDLHRELHDGGERQ